MKLFQVTFADQGPDRAQVIVTDFFTTFFITFLFVGSVFFDIYDITLGR